jgi:hypothetical protein
LREQQLSAPKTESAVANPTEESSSADAELQISRELEMQEVLLQSEHEEVTLSKVTVTKGAEIKADIGDVEIPDLNSKVTCDMILTVVAERYGQKDLLRFRDSWVG